MVERRDVDFRERLGDVVEEARVRWFMLDASAKQAILLGTVYFLFTLLDVGATVAKMRMQRKGG